MTIDALLNFRAEANALQDQVILVTGASSGLGRVIALEAAKLGATVILLSKTIKKLEAVYDEIEAAGYPTPAIYPMNFEGASVKDYQEMAENIQRELGRLDAIVHNAAWIGALTPFKYYETDLWSKVITVNLHAPYMLTRACLPLLESADKPRIIFSGHDTSRAFWGAFGVAKAGQDGLMKILAAEYRSDKKITVNSVDTGPIRTNMRTQHYPGEDPNMLATAEEVVSAYLYCLSDQCAESGQVFDLTPYTEKRKAENEARLTH